MTKFDSVELNYDKLQELHRQLTPDPPAPPAGQPAPPAAPPSSPPPHQGDTMADTDAGADEAALTASTEAADSHWAEVLHEITQSGDPTPSPSSHPPQSTAAPIQPSGSAPTPPTAPQHAPPPTPYGEELGLSAPPRNGEPPTGSPDAHPRTPVAPQPNGAPRPFDPYAATRPPLAQHPNDRPAPPPMVSEPIAPNPPTAAHQPPPATGAQQHGFDPTPHDPPQRYRPEHPPADPPPPPYPRSGADPRFADSYPAPPTPPAPQPGYHREPPHADHPHPDLGLYATPTPGPSAPYPDARTPAPPRPTPPPPAPPIAPPPRPAPPAPAARIDDRDPASSGDDLVQFSLQKRRHEGPRQGVRSVLHRMHIPVRKSRAEQEYDADIAKINKPIRYAKTIGLVNFKGGVGKTTTGLSIASTVAQHRLKGEVVIIDTDHKGSLARRTPGTQTQDLQQLVADPTIASLNDVKSYMLTNSHRVSVLGASTSSMAAALQPEEYLRALQILQANHLFVFVDMGASAATPAYETVLESLDAIIIPVATALDSAHASRDVMDWLRAHGMQQLAKRVVVLLNYTAPGDPHLDTQGIALHYKSSEGCPVIEIPFDEHLAEAGPISLDLLNKDTRRMFVKAAAEVVNLLPSV